jgi:hypothetical protein
VATSLGWDAIIAKPHMPTSGGTTDSDSISVPRGSQTVSFHIPALAGAATWKLQALDPIDMSTWRDIQVFNLASGGIQALGAVPNGSKVTTFPTSALGSGVIKVVASADQSGAPFNFSVVFNRMNS